MLIDALVLAGGRSSRLGAVAKAGLKYRGQTLLERTVAAVAGLRFTVVVGDTADQAFPVQVLVTREDPPFGGPAAGIGAGLASLVAADPIASDYTIVLACDMPNIGAAVPLLLSSLTREDGLIDGLIAVDSRHHLQPLAAAYRTAALLDAIIRQQRVGSLSGLSVFQLIRGLRLSELTVPDEATSDVDTWADADSWGIEHPPSGAV